MLGELSGEPASTFDLWLGEKQQLRLVNHMEI